MQKEKINTFELRFEKPRTKIWEGKKLTKLGDSKKLARLVMSNRYSEILSIFFSHKKKKLIVEWKGKKNWTGANQSGMLTSPESFLQGFKKTKKRKEKKCKKKTR